MNNNSRNFYYIFIGLYFVISLAVLTGIVSLNDYSRSLISLASIFFAFSDMIRGRIDFSGNSREFDKEMSDIGIDNVTKRIIPSLQSTSYDESDIDAFIKKTLKRIQRKDSYDKDILKRKNMKRFRDGSFILGGILGGLSFLSETYNGFPSLPGVLSDILTIIAFAVIFYGYVNQASYENDQKMMNDIRGQISKERKASKL